MSEKPELFTSVKIAESLGISAGKVKKLIAELNIEPHSKKGVCCYYSADSVEKIKSAI